MSGARLVVTVGGNSGIVASLNEALIADGYHVVTTRRPSAEGQDWPAGDGPAVRLLDVTEPGAVETCFEAIEAEFGAPYALVYGAGLRLEAPIRMLSEEAWHRSLDVNLLGAFRCVRAVSRSMCVEGRGRIVMLGSLSARVGSPGQAAYAASKAGLEAMTKTVAVELGRFGVTCNVVAPGGVISETLRGVPGAVTEQAVRRTPLRRLGRPQDVVAAVRWLLAEETGFVTGQTVVVDGGLSVT